MPLPTALIIHLPPFECPINIGFDKFKAFKRSFTKFPKSFEFNGCSGKSLFPNPTTSIRYTLKFLHNPICYWPHSF